MQTLNEHIKAHTFKTAYLLYGEEAFLKKSYKNRLREAITNGDTMNYNYYEGKGIPVSEIIALADTMPFFAEKRLILIEDSGWFKGGAGAEEISSYIENIPDTTCLLFAETEVDKRSKLYKAVKKWGCIAEMTRQDSAQLGRWAAGILAKSGKRITGRTMEFFLSKTGDDMENISSELEKLISYTLGRDVITDEDVEAICTTQVTNKIFDMITAIANRQTKKAMDLYEDLLTLKEPPMRILFLIARQFNQILQVKELMGKGMDKSTISSKLKLQPFVTGKVMLQAKNFTNEQILSYVNLCVDAEEGVKTGKLQDRLAVELLIANRY
ncbi:DNA polymerase III subunit delta [Lacrimispora sp. 210928-DFI.3.58]|mgnify:CR=1 FL=1|uniref:DNA polymerase III subunit delta n=1 Tax=Lacrimispora sp. 210928-DFI.3.58 TaxID=2883214 RepID=UPI0015B42342|nr:DNA polymerase III subunit delta [Lacrimispora sp. 210928-DFI.3.58]MCB7320815.1 DNA polymerase III subunit delta [Lacrimispora sp. 210928-DFI.3.58]